MQNGRIVDGPALLPASKVITQQVCVAELHDGQVQKDSPSVTKQVSRGLGQPVKVRPDIGKPRLEVPTLVIMRDDAARDPPQPLDAIGVWVIRGRIDERELAGEVSQHAAYQKGPLRGVSLEIVCDNDGGTSPKLRASHGRTHLLARCHRPATTT